MYISVIIADKFMSDGFVFLQCPRVVVTTTAGIKPRLNAHLFKRLK